MRIRTRARAVEPSYVPSPRLRRASREPSSFDFALLRRSLARFFVITSRTIHNRGPTSPDGSKKEAGSKRFVLLIQLTNHLAPGCRRERVRRCILKRERVTRGLKISSLVSFKFFPEFDRADLIVTVSSKARYVTIYIIRLLDQNQILLDSSEEFRNLLFLARCQFNRGLFLQHIQRKVSTLSISNFLYFNRKNSNILF